MKMKAVLFDMDGVITETNHLHHDVWKELMKPYDIDLTEELYINHFQSRNHKEALISILGDIPEEDINKLSNEKNRKSIERLRKTINVYQDAKELIEYLYKKNFTLAVVSASSNALFVIKEIQMDMYFDLIISGTKNTDLKNKPHPDIYLHAMKRLEVSSKETYIIEDSVSGITAGLKSGAHVIVKMMKYCFLNKPIKSQQ